MLPTKVSLTMLTSVLTASIRSGNIIVPEKVTNTSRSRVTWLKLLRKTWKCQVNCLYPQSTQEPGQKWHVSHTASNHNNCLSPGAYSVLYAVQTCPFSRLTHEQLLWCEKCLQTILPHLQKCSYSTLIATGWMVPPTSKLPFLNIITDVLLMQVPGQN